MARLVFMISVAAIMCYSCSVITYVTKKPLKPIRKYYTVVDTIYDKEGKIQAIGNYSLFDDSTKSDIRLGKWTEYYPNGQKKSEGNYHFDSYKVCHYIEMVTHYINFKVGEWKYYYPNGVLKAEGKYSIRKKRIGAWIYESLVNKKWKYYDSQGNPLSFVSLLSEKEIAESNF